MVRMKPTFVVTWVLVLIQAGLCWSWQDAKAPPTLRPPHDRDAAPLPKGAIARFGSERFRQGDFVPALAVSRDGKLVASISPGRPAGAKVWNFPDGKLLHHLTNRGYRDAVFLHDNKTVALATWEAGVVLVDLQSGKETRKFDAPNGTDAIALSPDGKTLAVWAIDWEHNFPGPTGGKNVVWLFDVATADVKHRIERKHDMAIVGDLHRGNSSDFTSIKFLGFTADGKSIATGTWDKTITLYDVKSAEFVREFGGVKQPAHAFALSTDGKMLAAACSDGFIRGIDLANGKETFKFALGLARINDLTFTPDNKSLAIAGSIAEGKHWIDGDSLWDIATGKRIRHLPSASTRLVLAPDGKTLLAPSAHGALRLFDPQTGKELWPQPGHRGLVVGLAFSPDGKTLVSEASDRTIRFWDLKTGKQTAQREGFCISLFSCLAFAPDGKTFASRSDDKTISLRDTQTGKEIRALRGHPGFICPLAFTPDGKSLVSAERDGPAIVWNIQDGAEVRRINHPYPKWGGETVALSSDAALLAIPKQSHIAPFAGPHEIAVLDTATGKDHARFEITNTESISRIEFTQDKKTLVAGSYNGIVSVLDVATGKATLQFRAEEHWVHSLAVSPNSKHFATSGGKWKDNLIRVWDIKTGKKLHEFPAHGYRLYSLAFSPDGDLLASGGSDGNIVLWDLKR